jgi:ribonuclease H2 subunit C
MASKGAVGRIEVRGTGEALRTLRPVAVHHLPCQIKYDGPADVAGFFRVEPLARGAAAHREAGETLVSTFRGRRLLGQEVPLPAGCDGLVLVPRSGLLGRKRARGEAEADESEAAEEEWECQAVFESISFWNYDRAPAETDEARRWLDWLSVADAIHSA